MERPKQISDFLCVYFTRRTTHLLGDITNIIYMSFTMDKTNHWMTFHYNRYLQTSEEGFLSVHIHPITANSPGSTQGWTEYVMLFHATLIGGCTFWEAFFSSIVRAKQLKHFKHDPNDNTVLHLQRRLSRMLWLGRGLLTLCCGPTCTHWGVGGTGWLQMLWWRGWVIPLRETLSSNWAMGGSSVYSCHPIGGAGAEGSNKMIIPHFSHRPHLVNVIAKAAPSMMKSFDGMSASATSHSLHYLGTGKKACMTGLTYGTVSVIRCITGTFLNGRGTSLLGEATANVWETEISNSTDPVIAWFL